jgi:hypothetical protein
MRGIHDGKYWRSRHFCGAGVQRIIRLSSLFWNQAIVHHIFVVPDIYAEFSLQSDGVVVK